MDKETAETEWKALSTAIYNLNILKKQNPLLILKAVVVDLESLNIFIKKEDEK